MSAMTACDHKFCRLEAVHRVELRAADGAAVVDLCESCHGWVSDNHGFEVRDYGK